MQTSRYFLTLALAGLLAAPAMAALPGDFGSPAICAKLRAMPPRYKAAECNRRAPLRGECRFSASSNGAMIDYLIDDGEVLSKSIKLTAQGAGPYGLRLGDDAKVAARKVKQATGQASQYWAEGEEEPEAGYLQASDISCGKGKSYSIYVWFENGGARSVSVSTLPAI